MSSTANLVSKVKNGMLPLPRGVKLPEGTSVALIPLAPLPGDPPFLKLAVLLMQDRKSTRLNSSHT